MDGADYVTSALFEHRFWLQIMGDHAWWLRLTLVDPRDQWLAQSFVSSYDALLCRARQPLDAAVLQALSREAQAYTLQLRGFKLDLLRRHGLGQLLINLKPTTINHMVNELDEYLRVLAFLVAGQAPPSMGPLHHHDLWLVQIEGHANTVEQELDPVEKDYIKASRCYAAQATELLRKSQELTGYTRSGTCSLPALTRLNNQATALTVPFTTFLEQVSAERVGATLLGNLPPLIPEHYGREQCYYLHKLAAATGNPRPQCDPWRQGLRQIACR